VVVAGLLSLCCGLTLSSAATGASAGDRASAAAAPVLERFLSRADEPLREYRAVRVLEGQNEKFGKRARIEALTELSSAGGFTFRILEESGSEYVLGKVLRPLLETEAKIVASGDQSRSALTSDNYDLTPGEAVDSGLVKLLARPRRKDVSLIDGALYVTPADADLVRIEGRMAKNPSFWTTRVHVVREYQRIGGVRVPVRLDSTASIRFAGESTLSMTYDYEMVNGVPVR
jgi:hypothetical protein